MIVAEILVASEEATPRSVIEKHELISPLSRGSSHFFFYSSVPKSSKISILPVSGALIIKYKFIF